MRLEAIRAGALTCLFALLPLVVNPRWYDFYYWPKVQVLYGGVVLLTLLGLWPEGQPAQSRWTWLPRSPLGLAVLAWLGAVTVSTLLSVNLLVSLIGEDYRYEGLLTWLAYGMAVILSGSVLISAERMQRFVGALLLAAAVMAVLGLLQYVGLRPVPVDYSRLGNMRAWGTTGSPLALGAYLVLLLPVAISLYAREPHREWRWGYGGVATLMYAAFVATQTRAAWAAFIVGMAAWMVVTGGRRLREARWALLLLAGVLAAVTPAVLLIGRATSSLPQVSDQRAAQQRAYLWRTVTPLVWQRPLFGWGPETLSQVYPAYKRPEFSEVFPEAKMQRVIVDRPHNDLLQQAVATGLVGLALYGWLWITLFRTARRAARGRAPGSVVSSLAAGLMGGFAAYFFQLQFSFSYVSVAPVFWSLVGMLVALADHPGASGSREISPKNG